MTDRPTASTITDDQLDALYDERDQLASRVADWKESTRGAMRLNNELRAGRDRLEEELVTARSTLDRVRALHRKASHGEACVYCAHGQRLGYDTDWPCDTIRALDGTEQPTEVTP